MLSSYVYLILLGLVTVNLAQTQNRGRRLQQRQPVIPIPEEQEPERPKVYEIQRQISPNLGDGKFGYYSATSDGLESEQVGYFNNPIQSQVHQGSYTTMDEHGKVVRIDYIADKDGFRPVGHNGASILPTSPPVPAELAAATADILRQQKEIREQHLGYLRAGYAAHG